MATAEIKLEVVKEDVLAELQQHRALRPTELLRNLSGKYADVVIKEAVLWLLQEQSIKMTLDQQLQLAEKAA